MKNMKYFLMTFNPLGRLFQPHNIRHLQHVREQVQIQYISIAGLQTFHQIGTNLMKGLKDWVASFSVCSQTNDGKIFCASREAIKIDVLVLTHSSAVQC